MQKLALVAPHASDGHPSARESKQELPHELLAPAYSGAVHALLQAYRCFGYRTASTNPLTGPVVDLTAMSELQPATYGLDAGGDTLYLQEFAGSHRAATLGELLSDARAAYCGSLSLESLHVRSDEQRRWLHARMETRLSLPPSSAESAIAMVGRLAAVEAFERHHSVMYKTYKQFSMQGSESLALLLHAALEHAAASGVEDVVLGLPHRGRLNMMVSALGLPLGEMLSLFSGNPERSLAGWDIKDHAGCSRLMPFGTGRSLHVLLAQNPSHLESVSPVVCGMARALQDRKIDGSTKRVLPLLMHGDASFTAQGIVGETLNLSQTRGYGVGGTLHLILNNQIGSTIAHPRDARSTMYASDLARAIDAPVLHVNADEPEAVVFAAEMATDYRMLFGSDIVVDHVGYRREGHFVGDDPTITQPAFQRRIERHPTVVQSYGRDLIRRGCCSEEDLEQIVSHARQRLEAESVTLAAAERPFGALEPQPQPPASPVRTSMPQNALRSLVKGLATLPQDLQLHPVVKAMVDDWNAIAREEAETIDWRLAENLAYASLLATGFNVRVTGLDVGRGTFKHRQHLWHDQSAEADWQNVHIPLANLGDRQGVFALFESPLSEEAVLGFEYGYSVRCGRDLVVWEAQFGDFVNNAQVIIDQYIASGEAKWGYRSGLVMMLPHGLDGWGPEHSCAYLGRFLLLCADNNLQVAMPSSAAQMYHLLRRQALMEQRRPLVVMTPKPFFYACKPSWSPFADLAEGGFLPFIADSDAVQHAGARRVVLTSGKLYYDLVAERARSGLVDTPIARVEQLYPFPVQAVRKHLASFPQLQTVVWAQEEPRNHGAWHAVRDRLEAALPPGAALTYVGRGDSAASATCNAGQHAAEQQAVVAHALGLPTH